MVTQLSVLSYPISSKQIISDYVGFWILDNNLKKALMLLSARVIVWVSECYIEGINDLRSTAQMFVCFFPFLFSFFFDLKFYAYH